MTTAPSSLPKPLKKCALYARVSTKDQDCSVQLEDLRDFARRWNWEVSSEYVDQGESGRKGSRPALDRLLKDASQRRFDIVLVHRLDRFGRSVLHLTQNIKKLVDQSQIRFLAIQQGLDIDPDRENPFSRLQLNMLASFAEFEAETIRERVREGLARAKRSGTKTGKPIGRPRRIVDKTRMQELKDQGLSYAQIAKKCDVSLGVAFRRLTGKEYPQNGRASA